MGNTVASAVAILLSKKELSGTELLCVPFLAVPIIIKFVRYEKKKDLQFFDTPLSKSVGANKFSLVAVPLLWCFLSPPF